MSTRNIKKPFLSSRIQVFFFFFFQQLRFAIYDWDKDKSKATFDQDDLGTMECTLADVVRARGSKFERGLSPYRRNPGERIKWNTAMRMEEILQLTIRN